LKNAKSSTSVQLGSRDEILFQYSTRISVNMTNFQASLSNFQVSVLVSDYLMKS